MAVACTPLPATALQLPIMGAAVMGARGVCLLGYPFIAPASAAISCATTGGSYKSATIPRLPLPAAKSSVVVQEVDFLNAKLGRMLLDEYTSANEPTGSHTETEVWSTQDGGRNFRWPPTGRFSWPPTLYRAQDGRCAICKVMLVPVEDRPQTPREWEHWLATTRKTINVMWDPSDTAETRLIHVRCHTSNGPELQHAKPPSGLA